MAFEQLYSSLYNENQTDVAITTISYEDALYVFHSS